MTNAVVHMGEHEEPDLPCIWPRGVNAHGLKQLHELPAVLRAQDVDQCDPRSFRIPICTRLTNQRCKVMWFKLLEPLSKLFELISRRKKQHRPRLLDT